MTSVENIAPKKDLLFFACCLSLVVTAMTFAIRAGILGELADSFSFTKN